jgi:predicted nucleic acid-binding protein
LNVIFLETSALLRLILGEKGADEIEKRIAKAERLLASRLIRVEAERALIRIGLARPEVQRSIPALERELRGIWAKIHFFEISEAICEHAGRIAPRSHLRTLDAIHLATYQRARKLHPEVEILSFDQRLMAEL